MRNGTKHTPKTRAKLTAMLLGYRSTEKFKKAHREAVKKLAGKNSPHYGKKRKPEIIAKIRLSRQKNPYHHTKEAKERIGLAQRGSKNANWKGGITPESEKERKSIEYYEWRRNIFHRDRFTCRVCLSRGYVQANHIYPFRSYKELRYDINNGITLCVECHKFVFKREHLFINFFQ